MLTVRSDEGPGSEKHHIKMGVFTLKPELHNEKPMWSNHNNTAQIYNSTGNITSLIAFAIHIAVLKYYI